MKQLLFLLFFPCLALAQYQGNAGQKITLGEQTTADGLVWRGITSDTVNLMTNKIDTSAYLVLDTITEAIWLYRASTTPKWNRVVDSLNNLQGQLSLTSKVTGVLPVANGGTNRTTMPAGYVLHGDGTSVDTAIGLFWDRVNFYLGIGTASPTHTLNVIGNYQGTGNIISSAGFLRLSDGSATNPSVQPGLDGDTGFFRPGNNIIGFTTGGVEKMRITSNGNIGFGQTTPTAVLHLKAGTATASTAPLKFTSGVSLTTPEVGAMEFSNISGTNKLYISPENNVRKEIAYTDFTNASGVLPVANGGTGTGTAFTQGSVLFAGASGTYTQDISGLFFNATSNLLGIGTASPSYALDVIEDNEPSQTNTFAIARFTGSNTTANDLSIIGPSGSQVRVNFGRVGRGQDGEMGYNNNTRAFRLVSAGLETARFDSLQRVGIGTTGPTARLHVKGSGVDGNTTALKVDNNGNANLLTILDNGNVGIGTSTPTTQMQLVGSTFSIIRVSSGAGSVSRFDFGTQSSPDIGRLTFNNVDSSIRIRPGLEASELSLLKNGNLGISIATPTQKLHVVGNGLFTGSVTANSLSLTTPLSVANGGTGENMSSLPNNYLIRKNSSGIFDTAAIFESGGNVGIGTNAPTNNLSILGSGIAATRLLIDGNGCQGTTPSGCITDLVLRRTTGRGFAFQILSDSLTDTNFNVESTVSGANQMRLRTDSNLSGMNFINGSSTAPIRFIQDLTPRLIINSGGEILIGYQSNQDNGAYRLQVNSQIFATNATIATSDIKFKENIQPLDKGLEIINKLKPVKFNFITTTENNFSEFDEIGFIAQDVEGALSTELFAKAVVKKLDENKDDSALGLMTEKFIPILVKAIQEQQALIKALEQRIINLENK